MTEQKRGKRERTRELLISAAAEIVGKKGFHDTTLEEVAARAGMSRGAVYGNFKNREDLFLTVVRKYWEPIVPELKVGATFREQMQTIAEAVIAAAPGRQQRAVGALSFQLYALTHAPIRARIAKQNAQIYGHMAKELTRFISANDLPVPAENFIRTLHALTEGLLLTRFMTPDLITDEVIRGAFEMLTPQRLDKRARSWR
jgi:AcrR family transcriptional regulator